MKTRDIRSILEQRGYERGTLHVLEALNEEVTQTRRDLNEMAHYMDKIVDSMSGMLTVAENMKGIIDKNRKREEDLGVSTQSLGDDT